MAVEQGVIMKTFWKGVLVGAIVLLVIGFLVLAAFDAAEYNREAKLLQERKDETKELLQDYRNRDPNEYFNIPGVRGAADSGIEYFRKRRDEVLQRNGSQGDNK
jgi:hypothetical protein